MSKAALKAVRPLYRNIGTKPNHLGTVTFVEVDGVDYVLTAAHVIDHHKSHTLFIGHKGLQPVTLTFRTTVAPGGNRDQDRWDFSFARIESTWRGAGIEPLSLSNLPALTDTQFFTAVGYPTSANRKYNPTRRTIRPTQRRYASARIPADHPFYKELNVSPATHIAITRDGRFSFSGGAKVNTFEPRGMSGGVFFGFPDIHTLPVILFGAVPTAVPAGLIIERNHKHRVLFGPSLNIIAEQIRSESAG